MKCVEVKSRELSYAVAKVLSGYLPQKAYCMWDLSDPSSSSFATDLAKLNLTRSRVPDAYIAKSSIQLSNYLPNHRLAITQSQATTSIYVSIIQYEVGLQYGLLDCLLQALLDAANCPHITAPPYDPACLQQTEGCRPRAGESVHATRKTSYHLQYQRLVVGTIQCYHESADRRSSPFIPTHTATG